jgi:hypothetical protein
MNKNTDRIKLLFIIFLLLVCAHFSYAQPNLPQRSLTVAATQSLQFGTFALGGAGGTVSVGWDGIRTSTGSIVLLAITPNSQPAIFEIKLCQGRNVIINLDPTTILTGSEGGTLTLNIGPTEKGMTGAVFSTNADCNFITILRVGGTLNVPSGSIPGVYTGSFDITFNQE